MPIGGNAQVTINVGARLQVLQSSVNEIQKVLDKLQPNSTGFKNLQTILNQITREMDHLQVQASKPFGSQNQFNQTEKTLDRIEDSLNNAQIALGRISFKDLKLSPDQEQQFKDLRNDIAETKKALDSFKNEQKIELFKNADFKKFADSIDSNLIKKNFSEVAQAVSEESERITNEIFKLTSKINQASKEISVGENVEKFTGFLDKDKTIKKQFEQFFTQTEQGLKFKPKQQNAFYEYLKEYFSLNDQQLNALKKLSAQKVQEVMTQDGYFEPQLRKAKNAATRQVSYNTQMTGLRTQAEAAAAAMGTVETAEEKIAEQSSATEDTVRALEERIRQLELQLTGAAQAAPEMRNGIAGMTGELNSMRTSLGQANAQFLQLQRQRQTFESIKSGIVNFMGFNQVLNMTRNAVRAAINHIKELDTTMNGIAIVTDMTTADLWKQVDAYSTMAQNFGVTIQGAYEVSKIYYQAGYETNDVLTLTNETLKLSKISGLDYATTTDYMMTAMRGFKLEMEDASRVVDVYSNLAANTAVSQQELAEAMTRTASSMESVGATFEETSAMIATMVAVTRESANNIGSAMKSIASRYGELTKDPAALLDADGEAMSFNKVDTALKSVGITLQTTDHQFRDFTDVIIELAEKWDTLDNAQQRYIATQFAGNRQQSRFLALVSNIDLLQENIANAENSEDVGTLQALKAMDSLESKINQVQVAYQQFYTTIGIESAWKGFLDGAKNVIDTLNSLPKVFGKIPAAAIILIMNAIQLIKNALLSGVATIAKTIKSSLNETETEIEKTAQDAQKQGKTWAENLAIGFETGAKKLKSTVTNVIDGLKPAQKAPERKYTSEQGAFFNNWDSSVAALNMKSKGGKFSSANSSEWKQAFNELLEQLNAVGLGFDTSKMSADQLRTKLQELSPAVHKLAEEYNNTEKKIKEYDAYQKQHQQNVLKAANTFSELGTGLSSLSLLFNDGSRSGKAFSGVMMILGGALTAVAAGMKAVQGASGWIGLAFTAITTIVSGISLAWETSEEKIERLNKEAEELNNKAKEAKANYNTIKRSAEQYTELEKKRYDSAEAAEAYQNAVEELADKFPRLIDGINDVGEVSINANNIELELAKAREQTANATYEALKAEQKAKIEELNNLKNSKSLKLKPQTNSFFAVDSLAPLRGSGLKQQEYNQLADKAENLSEDWERIRKLSPEEAEKELDKFKDNIDNYVKDYNTLLEKSSINFKEDYKKYAFDIYEALGLTEYFSTLKEIADKEAQLTGITKAEAAAWIRKDWVDKQDKNQQELFEAFNGTSLSQVAATALQKEYNKARKNNTSLLFSDWVSSYEEANNLLTNLWTEYSQLPPQIQKQFDNLFKQTGVYSGQDIVDALKLDKEKGFGKLIFDYYQKTAEDYNTNIEKALAESNLDLNLGDKYKLAKVDWDFVSEAIKQADNLFNISYSQFNEYSTAVQSLYDAVQNSPDIQKQIVENGLNTIESINKSIEQLDKNDSQQAKIIDALETLKGTIHSNVYLTISSMTDTLLSNWKDNASDISALQSGTSFDKANEFIQQAHALGFDWNLSDIFIQNGEKLILQSEKYDKYVEAYYEKLSLNSDQMITDTGTAVSTLEGITKGTKIRTLNEEGKNETTESFKAIQKVIGDAATEIFLENTDFVTEDGEITEAGLTELKSQVEKVGIAAAEYQQWLKWVQDASLKLAQYSVGNYTQSIEELEKIASNQQIGALNFEDQKIKENLNKVYSSLLSDAVNLGIKNINLEHYQGLIQSDKNLNEILENGNINELINTYYKLAGITLEEANALIVQAIEKDTAAISGAAKEALAHVDFYGKNKAFASKDTIQKLANAIGVTMDQMLGDYNAELDQYEVRNIEGWAAQITGSTEMFFDSINSVINSLTKYINSGLDGKLQRKDVTNLNAQLEAFGVDKLSEADFSKTAEGLKISEQAAIRLYSELKNIDAIQSHITFNDLSKSLQDSNEHYKSVSSILAHIKELNEKINNLSPGDARRKEYERELAVAKEIAATRALTDEKSFKFMDNNLPSALQNPIDYVDAIGKMFKSMNASAKEGYMGVQDFYNMVNELNNLAALGGPIEFMGRTLDGSLESAADLIQRGFHAISNIEGEGAKVDLSTFGVDFANGADDMAKNVEGGIHAMAESQIKMLDAMIQFLETVVAMEQLGDIDDEGNGLDFEDMFDKTEEGLYKATGKMDGVVENIQKLARENPVLKDALDKIKVNGQSITNIFDQLSKGAEIDKDHAQAYFTMFSALYKMAKDGNYDLENLVQSIQQIAATSGLIGEIEINDTKLDFRYGKTGTYDKKNAKWTYNGKSYEGPKAQQEMYEAMAKDALGTDNVTQVGDNYTKQIGNDVTVTVDLGGKITYTYNGLSSDSLTGLLDRVVEQDETLSSRAEAATRLGVKIEYEATQDEGEKIQEETQTAAQMVGDAIVDSFKQGASIIDEIWSKAFAAHGLTWNGSKDIDAATQAEWEARAEENRAHDEYLAEMRKRREEKNNIIDSPTAGAQAALDKQIQIMSKEIEAAEQALISSQNKINELNQTVTALLSTKANLTEQLKEKEAQILSIEQEKAAYREGNEKQLSKILDLDTQNAELVSENLSLENAKANLIKQLEEKEAQISSLEQEKAIYREGNEKQTVEILKLTDEIRIKEEELAQINSELTIARDQLNGAKKTIVEREKELSILRIQLDQAITAYESLMAEMMKQPKKPDFGSEPDEDTEGFFDVISTEIKNALSEIENWKAIMQQRVSRTPSPSETINPTKSLYGEEPNKGVTEEEDNKVTLEKVEEATETQADNTQEQTTAIKEQSDSIGTLIAKLQEYLDSNREQYENTKDYTEYSIEDLNFIDEYKSHLEEYNKLLAILQEQIKDNGDTTSNSNKAIEKNTAEQEENSKSAEDAANGQKELAGAQDTASNSAKDEAAAQSSLAGATRNASGGVSGLGNSIQGLSDAAGTAATAITAAAKAVVEAADQAYQAAQQAGNVPQDSPPSVIVPQKDSIFHKAPGNSQGGRAKGNVALAGGTRPTLMGELGPELYVTNGHYYVAGQNGAEFVDLPSDAIVFNHLQTERLLKNGSADRGHAVTNEHKATSLATGNASGPAMASASAALAELKKIRAMWDAMRNASISDLGSKAGLGKKAGGGGSKDKGQVVKLDSGYIRDLERWYNLLRQIDRLEQDINYEEKLRSKLQADTVANGELIYESQRRTYEMLQRELDDRVELASLKKGYYEQRMAEIQAGPWGQLFYFNEEGVPQMKNLQFLADVFASSDEGGAVHNAREQYAMLQQAGFGSLLQYKEDGSAIEWTDDEGKPREEAYKEAVEAFSAKLDAQTEEVNSLREDYIEEMGNILDLQTKQNEILTQIRENTIAVEQEVLKAIEDFREREIDELQKQRDALSDSADKFIDGLTDSLNKEREMYNSQQEDTELLQMRRQLAILQRSGGSASQIRSLQEQIRQREQEAYFEEQENQINAIKEASDLQLERLDAQISLMQETLEYQKAHGLLWDQVHEIMRGTHEEITQFVTGNNSEWWAKSATQAQNDLVELDNKIGQWVAHRDDISALGETMKNAINNGIAAITSVVAKVSASQQYTVSGTGSYVIPSGSSSSGGGSSDSGGSSGKKKSSSSSKKTSNNSAKSWHVSASPSLSFATQSAAQEYQKKQTNLAWNSYHSNEDDEELYDEYRRWSTAHISQYSGGGLIDYTGPAWVDGTKKKPEGILNAEQLDMLRNSVLTRKNPVAALLADYGNTVSNTANASTYNTINRGESMSIGNVELNMNVARIANDYDARRAGEKALEQMVKIAQKNGVNNIKRR